ncbi:hypothetical protein CKO20_01625 [Rhodocyclus tenuis]|nr:hypothetical protein [Rhodocyclus tenuis]
MKIIDGDLLTRTVEALKIYFLRRAYQRVEKGTAAQWLGSVSGFLASIIPDATITTDAPLGADKLHVTADLLVECGNQRIIVEIKNRLNILTYKTVLNQVQHLMQSSGINEGVVFFLPTMLNSGKIYEAENLIFDGSGRLRIISPSAI